MGELRCVVLRGLPKELEEQVNKFLETTCVRCNTSFRASRPTT